MKKVTLCVAVLAIFVLPSSLVAQNGFFDDLFLDGGAGGDPFVQLTDGSEAFTLKNRFGDLEFINRFNQLCIEIDEFSPAQTMATSVNGVAIGHTVPNEALHIFARNNSAFDIARIMVENAQSISTLRNMLVLRNNGPVRMSMENTRTNDRWLLTTDAADAFAMRMLGQGKPAFTIRESGQVSMRVNNLTTLTLQNNGNLVIAGTLVQTSDRNMKENFADADADSILNKVVNMPITTWNFKNEKGVRHIGPMAQDFQRAFQLSDDETTIAPIDSIGVAFAAIQGLNSKIAKKDAEIANLKTQMQEQQTSFEERLRELEATVSALSNQR